MPLIPTRRLALLVLLTGAVFLVSTTAALLLDALLLVLIVAEGVALLGSRAPEVVRSLPDRVPLDSDATIEINFRHPGKRPLTLLWTDDLPPGLERLTPDRRTTVLPPAGEAREAYLVHARERGRLEIGDVHLRVLGTAGLLWRQIRIPSRDSLAVQPGLRQLRANRAAALHSRRELGRRRTREIGEGREFERLREYVRGDDTRRIDWKATAKRGQTIVREFAAERSQSIVIAIDAGRLMAERFGGRERLDHALAAALVLADAASVHGDSVGLLAFADSVQLFLPPARTPLSRIADALLDVQAVRVEPDYPAALGRLGRQLRRRSLVVLFSDVIDARASAALLAHLTVSSRRHLPLLVAMRNTELEAAARASVENDDAAYRRSAAEELLQVRAAALGTIRQQGVLVADVRPEDAVVEAVARYVEIKRRGRL